MGYVEDASSCPSRLTADSLLPEAVSNNLYMIKINEKRYSFYSLLSLPMVTLGAALFAN